MLKGVEYRRIDDAGLHIVLEGKDMLIEADTVIVCAGQVPNRKIGTDPISGISEMGSVPIFHFIGGAKEAGELDAERAMLEGAQLAAAL